MKKEYYVLCPARHDLGELEAKIDGAIFPSVIESPMDFNGLEAIAQKWLDSVEADNVYIVVTGLTPALIAALNVIRREGKRKVRLLHYDRESGAYKEQDVY